MKTQSINQDAMAHCLSDRHLTRCCTELATRIARHTNGRGNGILPTAIPQLAFMRDDASTTICTIYEPAIAIILQGKKKILLGEKTYHYGVAQSLVVAVELPVRGFIVEATPDSPFLGFLLKLAPIQLSDIIAQVQPRTVATAFPCSGLSLGNVDLPLMECTLRLTQLLDTPQDIQFLAPLMIREIYYRLLMGEHGEIIRQIITSGSHMQRIAGVIERLKADFALSLRVEELAEQANMSVSSFHRHFKTVTSMSPLQYQKQLRLLEARRLMLTEDTDATHAAYQVGYESPSQFSREYSRMFGAPPIQDIQQLRIV